MLKREFFEKEHIYSKYKLKESFSLFSLSMSQSLHSVAHSHFILNIKIYGRKGNHDSSCHLHCYGTRQWQRWRRNKVSSRPNKSGFVFAWQSFKLQTIQKINMKVVIKIKQHKYENNNIKQ